MKGTVQFFDLRKMFGMICLDGKEERAYVHARDVQGEAKALLPGEPVEFELVSNDRGYQALKVHRTLTRLRGIVETFDRGFGFVTSMDGKHRYFAHHTDILGDGFKRLDEDEIVEFAADQT
jgi:CspA family cold shock protein